MGYELRITRKENWFDEGGLEISLDEWTAYVRSDPEMRLDGFAETPTPDGGAARAVDESLAVWTAHEEVDAGGGPWMWRFEGNVVSKGVTLATIRKMWRIAQALDAKLVGDDGEEYDADGVAQSPQSAAAPARPWWRFW